MESIESVYKTKSQLVFERLRLALLNADFEPGAQLSIARLAEVHGVSMAPVREALQRLEMDNLIESQPHKGYRVTRILPEDLRETFLIRGCLEGLAARLVSERITPAQVIRLRELLLAMDRCVERGDGQEFGRFNVEFHLTLYGDAGARLFGMLRALFDQTRRYRAVFKLVPARMYESQREHRRIVDYLTVGPERSGIADIEDFIRKHTWMTGELFAKRVHARYGMGEEVRKV